MEIPDPRKDVPIKPVGQFLTVAPVMFFTTVMSVMMCARLDRAQKDLGRLFEVVECVRDLLDTEDYGRFEAAVEKIEEIRSEFEHAQRRAGQAGEN